MKTRLQVTVLGLLLAVVASYFVLSSEEKIPSQLIMTTVDGQKISLTDFKGKTVLVNFWATSCTGCMQEMPELKKLQLKYGPERLQTIAIAMSYDQPQYIESYRTKEKLPFKVVHDTTGNIAKEFGEIQLTPTNFLIDKNGKLIKKYIGEPNYAEIISKLN
jgi:peroxiredoxin